MLESTKKNLASQGMPFNDYLEKRGMTEAQVVEEMLPQAEKRVALDLIFAKIAKEKEIKPDDAEMHRVAHALMHQGVPDHAAHQYGAEVSIREQVWIALGVAEPKPKAESKVEPEPHDHTH
jgi:FKBP-type peptidyl-prolyl cis-trans isomerase (trigger factor)